jgi:hypothetical protein
MKNALEKEMSTQEIFEASDALRHISTDWNNLLQDVYKYIYASREFDFYQKFNAFEPILGKPHKADNLDNERPFTVPKVFSRIELDSEREMCILDLIRLHVHKDAKTASDDIPLFMFKQNKKEFSFDQGICLLDSIIARPHKAIAITWDDALCYSFATIGKGKEQKLQVWESCPVAQINSRESNIYQTSPITALYLKISQFERLGEVKDKLWVNSIKVESNFDVPQEYLEKMKEMKNKKVEGDVESYIIENTDSMMKCVYLKEKITHDEKRRIQDNAWKVSIVLECCILTGHLINTENNPSELLIVSCLQAILIDKKIDDEYDFYNYQNHMSHKPKILIKKNQPLVDAVKYCWARKAEDHWFANQGLNEMRRQLREFENKCYEVLKELYSCPNASVMLNLHQNYYEKINQIC